MNTATQIENILLEKCKHTILENEELFEYLNGLWKGKKPPYVNAKVLRNTNFNNDGTLSLEDVAELPVEEKQFRTRKLIAGDIIIERSGGGPKQPVGRVVFFDLPQEDYSFSNFTTCIRVKDWKTIKPEFLLYYLLSFYNQRHTNELQQRTTGIRNLNFGDYKKTLIPLPTIMEQSAIIFVLKKLQHAITQQEKIIAKTKEFKRSLMHRLFTYGLQEEGQKETDAGIMPINWDVVPLGDICTYTTGKLNANAAKENGRYPFFTCSQETYKIDNYSFDQEALLLAGNNARAIYSVKYYKGKFDAYQRTYVFTIKDKKKCTYMYLLYELTRKLETLRISSLGTTTKYITAGIISNLKIALPPLGEQEEIATTLQTIDEKLNFESNRENYLRNLFDAILNNLMAGQVRVKDIDFGEILN